MAGISGVRSLHALKPLDYLITRADSVAHRLIPPKLRTFIEDDLAGDGALIATLQEYAASDLNAKVAANRLHVHVNTAYYRLDVIAERTGCNVRSFSDLEEILIAIRLLSTHAPRSTARSQAGGGSTSA